MKTVTHSRTLFSQLGLAFVALAFVALLQACGGGDLTGSVAGVGSGGSGLASGTVSGFGSVYVDGVEIEDAQSFNLVENADGSTANTSIKLGQRVEVLSDATGAATQITVRAAIVGSVSSINTVSASLRVAGQTVTVNTNSAVGPLTVFGGGYASLASVAANDLVEVHGSAVAVTGGYTLLASRIEKLSGNASARIMGTVSALNATDKSFAINGLTVRYTSATLVPATATLANDQTVVAWGSLTAGNNPTLTATRVRVFTAGLGTSTAAISRVQAAGVVSAYSASAGTFSVQGLSVVIGTATVAPNTAALANGAYVTVNGTLNSNGSVAASKVQVRQSDVTDSTAQVRLQGAIGSFLNSTSFVVRDVPVDASAISVATACPGVTLGVGVYVDVTARLQAGTDVVKATALKCQGNATLPTFVQRQAKGTATAVVSASSTFTLVQGAASVQAVRWTAQTNFKGVTAAALSGTPVVVEGYLDGTVLVAREIRAPGEREADRYDPANGSGEWDRYDTEFRPAKKLNIN